MMSGLFRTLLTFEMEKEVFLREYGDKSYGIIPYFVSKNLVEVPSLMIFPIITSSIIYFAVGFEDEFTNFLFFAMTLCMVVVCAASFGLFASAAFKHAANELAPILAMPMILFGGFFANSASYYDFISWIQYISPIRYSLEALCWNEFSGASYDPIKIQVNGSVMERFGFDLGKWWCILYLGILAVGF